MYVYIRKAMPSDHNGTFFFTCYRLIFRPIVILNLEQYSPAFLPTEIVYFNHFRMML